MGHLGSVVKKSVRDFLGLRECAEEKELWGPFTFSQVFTRVGALGL